MAELDGSNARIPLGANFSIRAPGLTGNVERLAGRDLTAAVRTRSRADERASLDDALIRHGMRDAATIELTDLRAVAPPPGAAALRSPMGDDALELQVPDPGTGFDALVIAVDEGGAVTWNFPLTDTNSIEPAVTRGSGKALLFRVPRVPTSAPPPHLAGQRGLFGAIGRKLLKVLVYPLTDGLVGAAVDFFAAKWEARRRPYRLRDVTPSNYTDPEVPPIALDDAQTWRRLSSGRALLFVHGTFSTVHSGFGGLTPVDVQTLSESYGGRLVGFDHFTLSHSPAKNVEELVARVPAGAALELDIVCHSRGGLVARELVERSARFGLTTGRLTVKNVVFVGVPNAGTALTEPDHMVHMIDRLTSALNLFPDVLVTDVLEAIITAIKVIGHGGLKSLDGLAAMNPKGQYLQQLVAQSNGKANYFAVTTDYEPAGSPLGKLALADGVMDRIFRDAKNDLVVPTSGVFDANGSPCFPIPAANYLELDSAAGVVHTTYFRHEGVRNRLKQWLVGR